MHNEYLLYLQLECLYTVIFVLLLMWNFWSSCSLTVHQRKMKEVAVCGFLILLFDAVLSLALWAGLWLQRCSGCGGLAGVWAFGAAKWAALHVFTSALTDGKPQAVLCRLVALLGLLSPVFESGRIFMEPPSEPYRGPSPDLNMLLLGPLSSVLACMVWEKGLCGNAKMKKGTVQLDARRLLARMVKYFKPDTFYLIAAFSFLILGVICKCKILTFYTLHTLIDSVFFRWYFTVQEMHCFETIEINQYLVYLNFIGTCIRLTWWGCTWQKESKTCQHHCIISRFANPCHSFPNRWYIYPVVSGEGDWHAERSGASNWLLLCNWTAGASLSWKVIKLNSLHIFLSFCDFLYSPIWLEK